MSTARRCLSRMLPYAAWPTLHQELWQAGLSPDNRDDDDDPPYATRLSVATIRNAAKGWGRFLRTAENQQPGCSFLVPSSLVTPKAVRAFLAAMKAAGNCNNTIAARIWEIRTALRILCPDSPFRWLTSPGGTDVRSLFRDLVPRREKTPRSSKVLYEWGIRLMDEADRIPVPLRRALAFRNGLLIAVLASRAPRLRSVSTLRIGNHILTVSAGYHVRFGRSDMKTPSPLEYNLPAGLTGYIERYLSEERPVLLQGADAEHNWFWVGKQGRPLRAAGIERVIRRASKKEFGEAFGPHSFRYAMGTSAPMADPQNPAVASILLGNSPAVVEKHYNLGGQVEAARTFQVSLAEERKRTAAIARLAFARRGY